MTRSWNDVKSDLRDRGLTQPARVAEAKREMENEQRAYRLAQVRKSQARTQAEIAEAMGVTQVRVSKIERGDMMHTELGTLQAYIEAMGGRLRVIAEFGGALLVLSDGGSGQAGAPVPSATAAPETERVKRPEPAKKSAAVRSSARKATAKTATAAKRTAKSTVPVAPKRGKRTIPRN